MQPQGLCGPDACPHDGDHEKDHVTRGTGGISKAAMLTNAAITTVSIANNWGVSAPRRAPTPAAASFVRPNSSTKPARRRICASAVPRSHSQPASIAKTQVTPNSMVTIARGVGTWGSNSVFKVRGTTTRISASATAARFCAACRSATLSGPSASSTSSRASREGQRASGSAASPRCRAARTLGGTGDAMGTSSAPVAIAWRIISRLSREKGGWP